MEELLRIGGGGHHAEKWCQNAAELNVAVRSCPRLAGVHVTNEDKKTDRRRRGKDNI